MRHLSHRIAAAFSAGVIAVGGAALSTAPASAAPLAPAAATPPTSVIGLAKGAYGPAVRTLQQALNRVGIGVKYGVDGYFGSATQASVKAFQHYRHLRVTGVVDAATAAALGLVRAQAPAPPPSRPAPRTPTPTPRPAPSSGLVGLTKGAYGPAVRTLQQALNRVGVGVKYGVDGYFGSATQASVKAFQHYRHLRVTGVVDTATAAALRLVRAQAPAPPPSRPAPRTPAPTPRPAPRTPAPTPRPAPRTPAPTPRPAPRTPTPTPPAVSPGAGRAVRAALSQLGVPYRFAAAIPGVAFDCSGLTAWAWRQAGVSLPHQSLLQWLTVPHVPIAAARPGDLLFFHSPVSHVTIYVGNGMHVQAPNTRTVVQLAGVNWDHVVAVGRPG